MLCPHLLLQFQNDDVLRNTQALSIFVLLLLQLLVYIFNAYVRTLRISSYNYTYDTLESTCLYLSLFYDDKCKAIYMLADMSIAATNLVDCNPDFVFFNRTVRTYMLSLF